MSLLLRTALQSSSSLFCRSFHANAPALQKQSEGSGKFKLKLSGYHKFGLLEDDFLSEFHPDVKEAVRRLPEELRLARIYRAIRASQAEINHSLLPEEEWSKPDDDHNYLTPYLEEVRREIEERAEWEATH